LSGSAVIEFEISGIAEMLLSADKMMQELAAQLDHVEIGLLIKAST
jgi:hypothetical protein